MEFLTIHEASRQFDIPSRVVRYRLHQLMLAGKLEEGADYRLSPGRLRGRTAFRLAGQSGHPINPIRAICEIRGFPALDLRSSELSAVNTDRT